LPVKSAENPKITGEIELQADSCTVMSNNMAVSNKMAFSLDIISSLCEKEINIFVLENQEETALMDAVMELEKDGIKNP